VAGFDFVSLPSAFKQLHGKLIKSYAMEAILESEAKNGKPDEKAAQKFIKTAASCPGKKYPSVGKGWDFRFEAEGVVGSALLYKKAVIHTAFFRSAKSDRIGNMAGLGSRRRYRTGSDLI